MRITHLNSGEVSILKARVRHQIVCCVCGLTHDFMFAIGKGKISLAIWENEAQTEREFKKVVRRLKKEGLPEVAGKVREMSDAKQKNIKSKG